MAAGVVYSTGSSAWNRDFAQHYVVSVAYNNGSGIPLTQLPGATIQSRSLGARAESLFALDTMVSDFCGMPLRRSDPTRSWDEFGNPVIEYVSSSPTAQCAGEGETIPSPPADRTRQAIDAAWPVLINFLIAYLVLWVIFRALGWIASGFMDKSRQG